ncbi:phospholipase A2 inhibitor and Ly6/PLAUR domain-containing protein-like [Synchiropus picturatus]
MRMKAVTTLCLAWLLVGSAGALTCKAHVNVKDKDQVQVQVQDKVCADKEQCATLIVDGSPGYTEKMCLNKTICAAMTDQWFSIQRDATARSVFVKCCNKDKCNDQTVTPPALSKTPNGIFCQYCGGGDKTPCHNATCVGDHKHCWTRKEGQKEIPSGCVTSNTCGLDSGARAFLKERLADIKDVKCHNSAMSLKLSVALSVFWLGVGAAIVS